MLELGISSMFANVRVKNIDNRIEIYFESPIFTNLKINNIILFLLNNIYQR